MDDLHLMIRESEERDQNAIRYKRQKAVSIADPNRKGWVYGLIGPDGILRHIGVSFYPDHQLRFLARREDAIGVWIKREKPSVVLLEQVTPGDMSKRVKIWQRRFKGLLLRRANPKKGKAIEEMSDEEVRVSLKALLDRASGVC
tara:strand:+ start:845 stop:1276 length:432 start_codon:yes stop_codon:yes gene_type:complete